MKTEIQIAEQTGTQATHPYVVTAPSIRVPVTAGNRAFLRQLRAAELTAWEEADHDPRRWTNARWFSAEAWPA